VCFHDTRLHCLYCRAEIVKDMDKYKLAPMVKVLYSGWVWRGGGGGKVGEPLGVDVETIRKLLHSWGSNPGHAALQQ
jgi:hypothetical protein